MDEIKFEGVTYISSKRAARQFGYTKDYIGQLARGGKVTARLVGRNWYVDERSLASHKNVGSGLSGSGHQGHVKHPVDLGSKRSDISDDLFRGTAGPRFNRAYLASDVKYEVDNAPTVPNLPTISKPKSTFRSESHLPSGKKLHVVEKTDYEGDDEMLSTPVRVTSSAYRPDLLKSMDKPREKKEHKQETAMPLGGIASATAVVAALAVLLSLLSPFMKIAYSYSTSEGNIMMERIEILIGSTAKVIKSN